MDICMEEDDNHSAHMHDYNLKSKREEGSSKRIKDDDY